MIPVEQSDESEETDELDNELSKSPTHGVIPVKKIVAKKKKTTVSHMFMDFAKHHAAMLERLIKENENRIALEALDRRKVTVRPETPKERVKGKSDYHLLLKMARATDYYE